ncbi:hypothetical protein PsYK624_171840 [Phanerochaete sordida]|uniref:Uncharacterized protein n=1 Tax=Phanerochaete sordida TaxID=48140 RepID=A0A9P3GT55_9APHY|nr:hypothetical protein PsYK624_171840 [Phanerochaete sordida]
MEPEFPFYYDAHPVGRSRSSAMRRESHATGPLATTLWRAFREPPQRRKDSPADWRETSDLTFEARGRKYRAPGDLCARHLAPRPWPNRRRGRFCRRRRSPRKRPQCGAARP